MCPGMFSAIYKPRVSLGQPSAALHKSGDLAKPRKYLSFSQSALAGCYPPLALLNRPVNTDLLSETAGVGMFTRTETGRWELEVRGASVEDS